MPNKYQGPPEEALALSTYVKLTRATSALYNRLADRSSIEDLTPTQFGVLETLYHLGPLCQHEIGGRLLKSGGNMTMVIDNLEKRDFVRRDRNPEDRREIIVSLTDLGSETIVRIFPNHAEAIRDEMSILTADEQHALGNLCRKLGLKETHPGG